MSEKAKGTLIIIGGHEDKKGDKEILKEVADKVKNGHLVLATVATENPEAMAEQYLKVFGELGLDKVEVLDIRTRQDAHSEENLAKLRNTKVVFFTGGDQLRISSQIGDSPVYRCMQELYHKGATIVGTSAGAAVMPATMLISGPSDESHEIYSLGMAPGLGLIDGVIIDSHFAERGRIGRILGAVAQNPKNLGIGIDEDTAIIVEPDDKFQVRGSGAVYVVDGMDMTYSSLSDKSPDGILSIYNMKLHVLARDDRFDLKDRKPILESEVAKERHKELR